MHKSVIAALIAVCFLLSSVSASAACTLGFLSEVTHGAGTNAGDVAAGDFNHDGLDDLAVVNRQSTNIAILLGEQGGTFADPAFVTTTGANQADILAAFMNADAHLDLVVMGGTMAGGSLTGTHVQVLLGDGNGGFTAGDDEQIGTHPYHLAAADFDDDGDTDIAVSRSGTSAGFNLLLNSGGVITQKSDNAAPAGGWIDGIAAGDFDGDDKMDVAITETTQNRVWFYFGLGDGTFTLSSEFLQTGGSYQYGSDIVAADLNGDGYDDVIVGTRDSSGSGGLELVTTMSNGPSRTFGPEWDQGNLSGTGSSDLVVHDLNADGKLDVAIAGDSLVYVFLGTGGGGFGAQQTFGSGGLGLAVVDVDNDGGADLAATHFGAGTVGILQNVCGAVTLDFSSSANPGTAGMPVTITATVTSNPAATGTLTITDNGGTVMASTNLAASTTASFTVTLGASTFEFIATYSGDARYPAATRTLFQVMQPAPFGPPPGFVATNAIGGVETSWVATSDTYQYEVFRNTGGGYELIATTPSTSYTDSAAPFNTAILYKVRAIDASLIASAFSAQDFATRRFFPGDSVTAGLNVVRRVHLTELRSAADDLRLLAGLSATTWTDAVPTVIRAVHVNELRTAINEARTALGAAASTFSDPAVGTTTPIRAVHINEARNALR